eukprot:gene15200-17986_t
MQQIELFIGGERNYMKLEGNTGPVVYPAGFIYVYTLLYHATQQGVSILTAQYIFVGIYVALVAVVFALYSRSKAVPAYVLIFLVLSKRIHSIFALRLFNDGITMLLFYMALYLFTRHRWSLGCLLFSAAVSVKMNVLLYAPALLLLLLQSFGVVGTIPKLAICGVSQILFGLPFLLHNPLSYMLRAFEFSRQFMYKWTVNWRFVSEDIFLSKPWALGLLGAHLLVLSVFVIRFCYFNGGMKSIRAQQSQMRALSPQYIMTLMFATNFVGITFARSLHYQFYVWYFHTLPYLLWQTNLPVIIRACLLAAIEYCWNVYPSTPFSSMTLFACNLTIVIALLCAPVPSMLEKPVANNKKTK